MNDIARTPDGRIWEKVDGQWYPMIRVSRHQKQKSMDEMGGVVIYESNKLAKYGPGTVLQSPELGSMIASKIGDDRWLFAGIIDAVFTDEMVVSAFGDDGYEVIVEVKS